MDFSFDRVISIIGLVCIPVGIGAGLAMDTKTIGELRSAQVLFCIGATSAATFVVIWGATTGAGTLRRLVVVTILLSSVGLLLVEGIRWAQKRHDAAEKKEEPSKSALPIPPPAATPTRPSVDADELARRLAEKLKKSTPVPRADPPPSKVPPRFEVGPMTITLFDDDFHKASQVEFSIRNVGESGAQDIEYQWALLVGNIIPTVAYDKIDGEVGAGNGLNIRPLPQMIPQFYRDYEIRVWLRYKNADRPKDDPIVQKIYLLWGGRQGGGPSLVSGHFSGDSKLGKDYFDSQVPTPP